MNTPLPPALAASAVTPVAVKKKRVLLVDTSHAKRELRAEVMRKLGMDVDCAADLAEARSWWKAALYDLVLINMQNERGHRDKFCDDIRGATPPQRVAFLVGVPDYVADLPDIDDATTVDPLDDSSALKVAPSADVGQSPQPWGILEASRRISAVRSASAVRARAIRAIPAPPRDIEERHKKRAGVSTTLDELLRGELR